jgi:hypothetical protein
VPVKSRFPKPRKPQFSAEVLQLFSELEQTPPKRRRAQWFKDAEKHLMCNLFDMGAEFWMCQSPLDRSRKPCHPPRMPAHEAWHACRRLRIALLEATGLTKKPRRKGGLKADEDAQLCHEDASDITPRLN